MDIRGWSCDKTMQLPDSCFGRRFSQIFRLTGIGSTPGYRIHHLALPDVCVLWELWAWDNWHYDYILEQWADSVRFRLALGDKLPASAAEFAALEKIPLGAYGVDGYLGSPLHLTRLRLPIIAQGRRVVIATTADPAHIPLFNLALVFSGMPSEVPDWSHSV